jgi:16S rRNA (adenine1518-N6/adenine1519-N6)-dimethyltransferase
VSVSLITAPEIRRLAQSVDLIPSKSLGQNFVVDANTVRRIARLAEIEPGDRVLEIGPGLGSLTLALAESGAAITAIEIDRRLAELLPRTCAEHGLPAGQLDVVCADALDLAVIPGPAPVALVANLPYNVSVPVLLHVLASTPSIRRGLVMVQAEVADRLVAPPGSRTYGVPSVKLAWYASARSAGRVPPAVFWPVPRVDSGLVALDVRPPPRDDVPREAVFAAIDAAFAQRRKTLRAALSGWAGSGAEAEAVLRAAGIDPQLRGEALPVDRFADLVAARRAVG